ncbi:hypothetical protein [Xanthomonas arboricola]|uniref:hypothetical protein n=1 Tax=Xanthomonas arboricola TaxID=56448 RepID=UPI00161AE93D|nr:hypothetical protein [Xanthomonas arboricola]MBB5862159.1 hypothetical protein [Xanthomonas arboricola]
MRVRVTSKQKARIAAGFLFGARHSPGVQCIDHRQPLAISHQPAINKRSTNQTINDQAIKQSSNQQTHSLSRMRMHSIANAPLNRRG